MKVAELLETELLRADLDLTIQGAVTQWFRDVVALPKLAQQGEGAE